MEIRSHRDLVVWQRAMQLAAQVAMLGRRLPPSERFTMSDQLRRAAASVPANIAEGAGRIHRGDYLRFVSIARGSLMEMDTHLELAVMLRYLTPSEVAGAQKASFEVLKMLTSLARVLAKKPAGRP